MWSGFPIFVGAGFEHLNAQRLWRSLLLIFAFCRSWFKSPSKPRRRRGREHRSFWSILRNAGEGDKQCLSNIPCATCAYSFSFFFAGFIGCCCRFRSYTDCDKFYFVIIFRGSLFTLHGGTEPYYIISNRESCNTVCLSVWLCFFFCFSTSCCCCFIHWKYVDWW